MNNTQLPSMLHHRTLSNLSSHAHDEDLFSSITGLDDLAGVNGGGSLDDDLSFDDNDDSLMDSKGASSGGPARKGKNRNNSSSTAEKKATHNAVERARRESLNARFLVLADMLPGMVSSIPLSFLIPVLRLTSFPYCYRPKSSALQKQQSSTSPSI